MVFTKILLFENEKHSAIPTSEMYQIADKTLGMPYDFLHLHNVCYDFIAMIACENQSPDPRYNADMLLHDIENAIPYLQVQSTVLTIISNDLVEINLYQKQYGVTGSIPMNIALKETTHMLTPGLCRTDMMSLLHVIWNDSTQHFVPMHILSDHHTYFGFMDAEEYDNIKDDISDIEIFLANYFPKHDDNPFQTNYALLINQATILHMFIKKEGV